MILRWNKKSVTYIQGQVIIPGKDNVIPKELEEKVKNDPFVIEKMGLVPPLIELISKSPKKVEKPIADANATIAAEGSDLENDKNDEDEVFEDLNAKDSIKYVKKCESLEELSSIYASEERSSVKKIVEKRIEELS